MSTSLINHREREKKQHLVREVHGSPVWMQLNLAGVRREMQNCDKKMQIPTIPSDPPLVTDLVLTGVLSAPAGEGNEGAPAQETL